MLIWILDEWNASRNLIAKGVYIVSLVRLLSHPFLPARFKPTYLQTFLALLKPLLLVSGEDNTLPLVLEIF
jgi:hypothetical protein